MVGERVWSFDQATGTTGLFTVTAVIAHRDPAILHVTIGGELIRTTEDHPFFTLARGWVQAGEMHVGEQVRRADGTSGVVTSMRVVRHSQVMYNLTVAQAHTFFVGAGRWLVHNSNDCWKIITRGANLKDHYLKHKKILEKALGKKYPNWKESDEAAEFLTDLENLINNGPLQSNGYGTLTKDFPVEVFRGEVNGEKVTVILKPDGEFVTLLEGGTGMDLSSFLPPPPPGW